MTVDPSNVPTSLSTRSATRKMAFFRVLKDILEIPDDDILFKVLDYNGVPESMFDLISVRDEDFKSWIWNDGTDDRKLPPFRISQMRILRAWNLHLQKEQGKAIVDWFDSFTVSQDEWDKYRVSIYVDPSVNYVSPSQRPPGYASGSNVGPTRPPYSAAADFKRGIKRDKNHYKEIRDEKQWDDWKRSTVSTVYAHGCENILSQSYVPSSPDDSILFSEQQKFMYDVWVNIL